MQRHASWHLIRFGRTSIRARHFNDWPKTHYAGPRTNQLSVTQEKIAKRVGVSRTAVGFALRGDGHVSDETRQLILEAAHEMGYTAGSNREARLLAARRNNTRIPTGIVAVVSAVGIEARMENVSAYHGPLMAGIEMAAADHELALLVCSINAHRVPFVLRDGGVDGVICTESNAEVNDIVHRHNLRCVHVGVHGPAGGTGDVILPDESAGITSAVGRLMDLGHKSIGFISYTMDSPNAATRHRAYVDALYCNGIKFDADQSTATVTSVHNGMVGVAIDELLARCPRMTAIVCYNDWIAMEAIRALNKRGLNVPGDISVTGFDDTSLDHGFSPALSTVRTPRQQMGCRAVELLVSADHAPVTELVPVAFITRDSTGPTKGAPQTPG